MEFLADEARQITELPKCGASKLASETSKFGWKIWFLEVILIICISIYTRMYVIIYYVYVCISYDYVCIYIRYIKYINIHTNTKYAVIVFPVIYSADDLKIAFWEI